MTAIDAKPQSNTLPAINLELLEAHMLTQPQEACSVFHQFAPGIYVRGVHLPANTFAIGHTQKQSHLNIMLRGKVIMVFEDKTTLLLEAPQIFTGKPGKKVGYILEDTLWLNVYATDETDIATLEEIFLHKSDVFNKHCGEKDLADICFQEASRADYAKVLSEFGFSEEEAREMSENTADQTEMPSGSAQLFSVRPSSIAGLGVFASANIPADKIIGAARVGGKRTPLGRFVNHSVEPNAKYVRMDDDIFLVASRDIHGCKGGDSGTEITVNYREALNLIMKGNKI